MGFVDWVACSVFSKIYPVFSGEVWSSSSSHHPQKAKKEPVHLYRSMRLWVESATLVVSCVSPVTEMPPEVLASSKTCEICCSRPRHVKELLVQQ